MAKETFTASTSPFKIVSALFALCSILLLLKYYIGWLVYPFAFICIVLAYLLWKVPPPIIEVDERGIRRIQHGNYLTGTMSRILLPDMECEWVWVNSISTTRLNGGSFVTSISVSDDMPNKPKYRVTIESSIFTDYIAILKVIKGKATKAHFDKTTESILKGDVDIRPVRPYYLWLFVFTVIAALLHTYFRIKKG
jgi:hypothetical protein